MAGDDADDYSRLDYWDELVQRDPAGALGHVRAVLADPTMGAGVRAVAGQAEARALSDLGRLDEAKVAARAALSTASSTGDDAIRRSVAMSAAVMVAESGGLDEGLAFLRELAASSDGVPLGRVRLQEAYVLAQAGRLNEALVCLDASDRLLAHGGEPRDQFRVHQNRGLVLLQQGRLDAAESDFRVAEVIAASLGWTAARAQTVANLGVLHGRARRLAEAVRHFDLASAMFSEAANPIRLVATMEIDRAEVMMYSGLVLDAVDAARKALTVVAPTGNRMLLGDAQLLLARVELHAGKLRDAVRSAETAASTLAATGRHEMVAHASSIAACADLQRTVDGAEALARLDATARLVEQLRAEGWEQQAVELVLARVRVGTTFGLDPMIADDLEGLRIGAFSGQRDVALAGWYAEALCRHQEGTISLALDACRSGLDRLDDIVVESTTLAERSAAMRLGNDLSQLTIDLAVELGDADTVLAAAEGTRARALHDELAHLQRHRPLTDDGAEQLRRELAGRLSDRVLVEWVVAGGAVWAVVFDAAGSRLVHVADAADVVRARDRVLVWLDLAAAEPDISSERALRAAASLDAMLIGPLGLPSDCGVVNVPVGLLHGIPWAGLASFAGRPMTLVPNAQVWLEADRRATGAIRSVGFVSGPDVGNHDVEQAAVQRWHPGTAVAAGVGATAPTVRSMFAGYDLVHVAAHGRFRSDRPLLSTISLHDGASTLYDTVPERIAARLVVLSSCEGGAQGAADGSEVLGMSSVLLARGAASVVAPLTVVRELECAEFVADVHAELSAGEAVACALANVRERWLSDDDLSRWAVASSFTCFGSGAVTVAAP